MSVYIKGMELPTACCACPCSYDNICAVNNEYPTFAEWYEDKPDWCPLIPVPDHGRLIDADALAKHITVEWFCGNKRMNVPWRSVEDAPTIIPADKEGEE